MNLMQQCFVGFCDSISKFFQGTASKKKQMIFWENLLELVLTADKANFLVRKERSNPDFSR